MPDLVEPFPGLRAAVASGEGIFGIVDACPPDTPGAAPGGGEDEAALAWIVAEILAGE